MLSAVERQIRPPAAVHIDLDGARHVFQAHGWRYDAPSDPLFESGLRRALDFFARERVSATLFVIAEDLLDARKRSLVEAAVRDGHEIASHSFTHGRLTQLDTASKRREIADSMSCLTSVLGVDIRGFRAPGFHSDRECLEMINDAGYAYDSSVWSGRTGGGTPYCPVPGKPLLELPIPTASVLALPFHPSYSLVIGSWYFRRALLSYHRLNAPLILLFHLTDFADPLSSSAAAGWQRRLFTLSHLSVAQKLARCGAMLDLVQRHFTVVTTAHLLDQCAGLCLEQGEATS